MRLREVAVITASKYKKMTLDCRFFLKGVTAAAAVLLLILSAQTTREREDHFFQSRASTIGSHRQALRV